MTILKSAVLGAALALCSIGSVMAQESSYTPGTVWVASRIKTAPGQFENYMDWLSGEWKKIQEFSKKEGVVVSYHVLATNNPRANEPDLILVVEYKDYQSTAAQVAFQKKVSAMLAQDDHKQDAASGERQKLRTLDGSVEYQELKLK